jgi:hypothetical protein
MLQLPSDASATVAPLQVIRETEHAKAFRELEGDICDCAMMAKIAATMMSETDKQQYPDELIFAVMHASNMIEDLKKSYYAAWESEQ